MDKHSKLRIFYYILLLSFVVWIAESVVHIIIFSEDSFRDAIFFNVSNHEIYMRLLVIVTCCILYLLSIKNRIIKNKETQIENILNNVIPVCITDKYFNIVMANDSYWNIWGKPAREPIKCYDHRPGEDCHTEKCALTKIIHGVKEYVCESNKTNNNETNHFILTAKPFLNFKNEVTGIIESFQDITDRKKLENEKANLITELKSSLEKVKILSAFLPICAYCKKIRDDKGYWAGVESYISKHTDTVFSHGICPECTEKEMKKLEEFKKKTAL